MGYFSETTHSSDGVWISGTLTASDTAGAVFNWQNDQDSDVIVDKILVDVTTVTSDSSCKLDIGYTATSAATSSDTMIDGVEVHTNTGVYNNIVNAGTNGVGAVKVTKGKWITASKSAGATAGLVGYYYIHYMKIRPA